MIEVKNVAENHKVVVLENGDEIKLLREDPWGLWKFHWKAGDPPSRLSGTFTNPTTAIEFLTNYVSGLNATKKKSPPVKEV